MRKGLVFGFAIVCILGFLTTTCFRKPNYPVIADTGTDGGTTEARTIGALTGMAVDSLTGDMYVADAYYHSIWKIVFSTQALVLVAGSGQDTVGSFANGSGVHARFNGPTALTLDEATSKLYVADKSNHVIRIVDLRSTEYTVTTLAGVPGEFGDSDGMGSSAHFNNPTGIVLDSASGVLLVADTNNHTIRRVAISSGDVTLYAGISQDSGDGTDAGSDNNTSLTAAKFVSPTFITIDSIHQAFFVVDNYGLRIRKIIPTGSSVGVTTLTGGEESGDVGVVGATLALSRFGTIKCLFFDSVSNLLYITDATNHRVYKADVGSDSVSVLAGDGTSGSQDGSGVSARFSTIYGIVLYSGHLYVSDIMWGTIRSVNVLNGLTGTFLGKPILFGQGSGSGQGS